MEALDSQPQFLVSSPTRAPTYAEKIERDDRRLIRSAGEELERRVRALTPHVGAFIELGDGERLGGAGPGSARTGRRAPGRPERDGERLLLGTASGVLELLEAQLAGGRPMAVADAPRGNRGAWSGEERRADTVVLHARRRGPDHAHGPAVSILREPALRGTNLAGRYRCVSCAPVRAALGAPPQPRASSTIAGRRTRPTWMPNCGASMLQPDQDTLRRLPDRRSGCAPR